MNRKVYAFTLALALLAPVSPGRAANPRVSLKVESASCAEAVAALGRAAGVPIELSLPRLPEGAPLPASYLALGEKATFDWTGVPLSRAMRQLCERYRLRPFRSAVAGYAFQLQAAPAPAPGAAAPAVERNGVRVSLRSLQISDGRGIRFDGAGGFGGLGAMTLSFAGEVTDGDGEAIAGVENVVARDDQGNVLPGEERRFFFGSSGGQFPDEWTSSASLPAPHPRARKLQWVEGDLMAFRSVRPVRLEVPLPLTGPSARLQDGELTLIVSRYRTLPAAPDEGEEADLPAGFIRQPAPADAGPSVRARLFYPTSTRVTGRGGGWSFTPQAEGAAGRLYPGVALRGGGGASDGQWTVNDTTWVFPGMNEPPVRLVWELVQKTHPEKLVSFRLHDVPLPEESVFVPRREAPPSPARSPAADPERPFYEEGGATLLSPVRILEKPAAGGTLSIGLSARSGSDWGPMRWVDVEPDSSGTARLPDLKPGTYRVLRVYRPKTPVPSATAGKWLNAEVTVEARAGKSVALPPLAWK